MEMVFLQLFEHCMQIYLGSGCSKSAYEMRLVYLGGIHRTRLSTKEEPFKVEYFDDFLAVFLEAVGVRKYEMRNFLQFVQSKSLKKLPEQDQDTAYSIWQDIVKYIGRLLKHGYRISAEPLTSDRDFMEHFNRLIHRKQR